MSEKRATMAAADKPKAVDLSHHLSDLSRSRKLSPLKVMQKYWGKPGLLSLAGGMPSAAYFPFAELRADALVIDSFPASTAEATSSASEDSFSSWLWKLFGASSKEKTFKLTVPKYTPSDPGALNLESALQYRPATGLPPLADFINEFAGRTYQPAYENWTTLIHTGNTDAWHRCVATFCNSGEGVLCSAWTYPSAMATMQPYGVQPVPVAMDAQGMRADALEEVLKGWDETARGMKRPHVMYTVPVGQNPCGTTMGLERKKAIYALAVEYDFLIVEDDPYYFMQEGEYVPPSVRASSRHLTDPDAYIASLEPSYIKLDYQGRVVRLDTFSKTIAPGSRLGWFTCNPVFAERLERQGETSTQSPCGFSQALVGKLINTWGYEGYLRWLQGIGTQYTMRRDQFIDCLAAEFNLIPTRAGHNEPAWDGALVYEAAEKPRMSKWGWIEKTEGKTMFSFVPPTSGMFVWIKLHLENHPAYTPEDEETLEMKLWVALAEAGVLFAPGYVFSSEHLLGGSEGHFRISFSNSNVDDMKKAAKIFAQVLHKFFKNEL